MQKIIHFLVVLIFLTTSLYALTDLPNTLAGKRARQIVNLFNNENADSPTEYALTNFSEELKKDIASPGSTSKNIKELKPKELN